MNSKRMVSCLTSIAILFSMICGFPVTTTKAASRTINGVTVSEKSVPWQGNGGCWYYANKMYNIIWGCSFSSSFVGNSSTDYNMLRNLSDEELTLTTEHLKAYVSAAPLGSVIRVSTYSNLRTNSDGDSGHSAIIVDKSDTGFTVYENWNNNITQEKTYTWESFIRIDCNAAKYIKYIKYPNAKEYEVNNEPPSTPHPQIERKYYSANEYVEVTWNATENTTHYWLHTYKDGEDFENTDMYQNLSYKRTYPAGNYTLYITSYNNVGEAFDCVDFTVYDHKPEWAKVSLERNYYDLSETLDFVLTSDTGHAYTVGIDDADGNRLITYDTDVNQNSTTQHYTHIFDKAGQYSCYITTYNNYGLADSERIYFTVYDHKPEWAEVSLERKYYYLSETLDFVLSSDTGHAYTVGIDDENGNRLITYNTDVDQNSTIQHYKHIFDKAGKYSCYITTYNNYGHVDSERIYFSVYNSKPEEPKPTISKSMFSTDESISIKWDKAADTDTYWLHIYKEGEDYINQSLGIALDYTAKYPVGNYTAYIVSCNGMDETCSSPINFSVYQNGDVNDDGEFNISDVVVLQNWLLGRKDTNLINWKAADLCEDEILNVFDLCLMRRKLIYG